MEKQHYILKNSITKLQSTVQQLFMKWFISMVLHKLHITAREFSI